MDGFHFHTEVKVRFAETDAQGVAHNTAYIVWFEVARVDYLAKFAGGYQSIRDRGIEGRLRRCLTEQDRLDHLLRARTRLSKDAEHRAVGHPVLR